MSKEELQLNVIYSDIHKCKQKLEKTKTKKNKKKKNDNDINRYNYLNIVVNILIPKICHLSIILFVDVHQHQYIFHAHSFYQVSIFLKMWICYCIYKSHYHEIHLCKNLLHKYHHQQILIYQYHVSYHYSNHLHIQLLTRNSTFHIHVFSLQ